MRIGTLLALGAFAVLAGCATGGVKHADMKPSIAALKPGEGRIYFYRSRSMVGAAVQPDIKLNGAVVGTSQPGGFFFVDRPAGNYEASSSTEVERTVTFALATGETKYVRTSPSFGVIVGRINFQLVDRAQAEAELSGLSYTGESAAK